MPRRLMLNFAAAIRPHTSYMLPILGGIFLLTCPNFALADVNDTPIGSMFCTLASWIHGNTGRGLETIAMVILGLLATFNKLSWQKAVLDAAAIGILYGASGIITSATGGAITGCVPPT